jgi:hypothetical protein
MSDLAPILWATKTTEDRSKWATGEKLTNCQLQPNPEGSKSPFKIVGRPGLKLWSTYGVGGIRGVFFAFDRLFVVSGNELYIVSSDKSSVMIGAVPGGDAVSMIANETHVGIATNLGLYNATIAAIANTDGQFYGPSCYQDGYGILPLTGTAQYFLTGIDDMTSVNPLDFDSVDTFPDKVLASKSLNRQLVHFGETAIEQFYNSGDAYFPFRRSDGGTIQVGCRAAWSVVQMQDVLVFLANDNSVRIVAGNQCKVVSTPGIEKWISERITPEKARGLSYRLEGQEVYCLNFPDGSISYNFTTNLWSTLESWGETRWRAECTAISDGHYVQPWGYDLVGDFENGNIYELDPDFYYDENGVGAPDWIVRNLYSTPIHANGNRLIMDELRIDCEMGVGNVIAPGDDPQFIIDWSDDGGNTWSTSIQVSAGLIGEYTRRASINSLGQFYNRTLRLQFSDPCKLTILGAWARLRVCDG